MIFVKGFCCPYSVIHCEYLCECYPIYLCVVDLILYIKGIINSVLLKTQDPENQKVEISHLNDDLLGQILERVSDSDDRKRVSQVCKQWFTLERLTRRSLTIFRTHFLRQVLPLFPNLVTFRTQSRIIEADLEFLAQTYPKLEAIDLGTPFVDSWYTTLLENGLYGLSSGGGLLKLSKVVLNGRDNVSIKMWLRKLAPGNLTYLDLGRCSVVDDNAVEAIGLLCTCLSYLNLDCSDVSDNGLRLLANGRCSKTLKSLVLSYCCITDSGMAHLRNMQCLEGLNLAGTDVTDIIAAISGHRSIKKLNLSRLKDLSDQSIVYVAENCPNLEILDITASCITSAGIRAFSGHRCLESIALHTWIDFCWLDVEHMVLRCPSLKSIVLSMTISIKPIPESLSRMVTLIDEY